MKLIASLTMAFLCCGVALPACAQQPQQLQTPRPATPFSSKPPPSEQYADAERQLRAMQDIHQRMMNARTPQERRALMDEHRRAMRSGMAAMQGMHPDGMGHGGHGAGHHVQRQLAMMQMMMQMMMERMDMLEAAK